MTESATNIKLTERKLETEQVIKNLLQLVGQRVRAVRKQQRLSRRALSVESGVSQRYLAQLEAGQGNISIGLLQRLAIALNMPLEALVSNDDNLSEALSAVAVLYSNADNASRERALQILNCGQSNNQKAERLCLMGLRGAGKSALGSLLGKELGIPLIELNDVIEKSAGIAVNEIIALYDMEGYRQLESECLKDIIATESRLILAVAGGIVANPDTFTQLCESFHTIWIKASPAEHMDRVRAQGDHRPMAGNPDAMEQLKQILKSREAEYARAGYQLDTSGKTVDTSLKELSELVRSAEIIGNPQLLKS